MTLRPLIAILFAASGLALAAPTHAQEDTDVTMRYRGEIVDESGAPISGVFPLQFRIYEDDSAQNPEWQESHYVSVYEGVYDVMFGEQTPVPSALENTEVTVAVEMGDVGEIARHTVTVVATPPPQTREEVIAELDVTFAEIADRALFAVEATEAEDCAMLGGKTLEELDRYDEVLAEMVTLRDRLDDVTGARLGSRTTTLERVGGGGGEPYSRACPPGHVVTGVRGGAGAYIDSIELICSPLE